MRVGAGLYMYVVVVQKFTFAISSPDEFLYVFSFFVILFCLVPVRQTISWLHVSFWAHVNIVHHIISYHIISYHIISYHIENVCLLNWVHCLMWSIMNVDDVV